MVKVLPSSRLVHKGTSVDQASYYLKRCYVAERELMRTLAAWFVDTSQWDFKRQLAQDMWQTSRHADMLRSRVLELRYPRRDVDKKYDADVLAWTTEFAKGENTDDFIAGIYGAVVPELVRAYSNYLDQTDHLDDAPTAYVLSHILADKRQQIDRMQTLVAEISSNLFHKFLVMEKKAVNL
jgi:hypothetical protein